METIATIKKEAKPTKKGTHASIRVGKATSKQLQALLEQINKKDFGKHVNASAVLARVLPRLTQSDIQELQEASLSHKDRFERDYASYVTEHGKISRDEYLGLVMSGQSKAKETPQT